MTPAELNKEAERLESLFYEPLTDVEIVAAFLSALRAVHDAALEEGRFYGSD